MAALYVRNYVEELRRVGDTVFKQRHRTPFLVVIGKTAELVGESQGVDKTLAAARSTGAAQELALLNRVFPIAKQPFAPRGPIVLGRSGETDVSIPEYSISKRHCLFEFEPEGVKILDCGSTNGTIVGDEILPSGEAALLKGGEVISLGRFAFQFYTAMGFHSHVKGLLAA